MDLMSTPLPRTHSEKSLFPGIVTSPGVTRAHLEIAPAKSPSTLWAEYHLLLEEANQSLLSGLKLLNASVSR
jgi:hypothetical protein